MYHELADDDVDIEAWAVVRRRDFLRQMEYLRAWFDVVSLEEAIARHLSAESRPRPLAVVTFDDGDRGNADVLLPIVDELQLPVTIFVATHQIVEQECYWFDKVVNALQTSAPIELDLAHYGIGHYAINRSRGAANWAEIQRLLATLKELEPACRAAAVKDVLDGLKGRSLRVGCRIAPLDHGRLKALAASPFVTIGAHSHCHRILTRLDAAEVRTSVMKSKHLLEAWTGRDVWAFAYPNGDWNDQVAGIVRELGFRCAMSTGDRLWKQSDSVYGIPRIGVGRYDSDAAFAVNLVGGVRNLFADISGPGRLFSGPPQKSADASDGRV